MTSIGCSGVCQLSQGKEETKSREHETTNENKVKTMDTFVPCSRMLWLPSFLIFFCQNNTLSIQVNAVTPFSEPGPCASSVSWEPSQQSSTETALSSGLRCLRKSNSIARFYIHDFTFFLLYGPTCIFAFLVVLNLWRVCCSTEMKFKWVWTYEMYNLQQEWRNNVNGAYCGISTLPGLDSEFLFFSCRL